MAMTNAKHMQFTHAMKYLQKHDKNIYFKCYLLLIDF